MMQFTTGKFNGDTIYLLCDRNDEYLSCDLISKLNPHFSRSRRISFSKAGACLDSNFGEDKLKQEKMCLKKILVDPEVNKTQGNVWSVNQNRSKKIPRNGTSINQRSPNG